jgi:hypothetical protein
MVYRGEEEIPEFELPETEEASSALADAIAGGLEPEEEFNIEDLPEEIFEEEEGTTK